MLIYVVGGLFIFFSIGFLIFAITLAGYKKRIDKHIDSFEKKGNKILTWQVIDNFCRQYSSGDIRSISKLIDIFHSAVIDHSKIDGIKYYTRYPHSIFQIFSGNDGHRKSFIGMCLGGIAQRNKLPDTHLDKAVAILLKLTKSSREYGYTQLIAWNSLSKIARFKNPILDNYIKKQELLKLLSKGGISSIGSQKLVFTLFERDDLDSKLEEDIDEIIKYIFSLNNFTLKAIAYYKIKTASYLTEDKKLEILQHVKLSTRLSNLVRKLDQFFYGYSMDEITDGLKNLGIFSPPYDKSSSEGKIVSCLVDESLTEVCLPAFIYHFNAKRVKNKEYYDGVSVFEMDDPRKKYMLGEQNIKNLFYDNPLTNPKDKKENIDKNINNNESENKKDLKGVLSFELALKNMAANMIDSKVGRKRA